MAVQEISVKSAPHSADAVRKILQSTLRGLDIERRRQTSSLHLLSTDRAQVESLSLALKRLDEANAAIQQYLEGEVHDTRADTLLKELIDNSAVIRARLWPIHYRACEALTRMIDILARSRRSLLRGN